MRTGSAVTVLVVTVLVLCCPALARRRNAGGRLLQEAVNEFSVDLLKDLFSGEQSNLVISPVSVSTLLAMLGQGAKGNSARQIEAAIHLGKRKARLHYGRLVQALKDQENSSAKLEVANHVFVARKFVVRRRYSQLLQDTYLSGVERTTFGAGDGGKAINDWVQNATHGEIDSIVDPVLSPDVAMVMVNAMFFQSPWLKPFKTSSTTHMPFNKPDGSTVTVPFMMKRDDFSIGDFSHLNAKWIELPFLDEQYSVIVVVPQEIDGLPALVQNITASDIATMISYDNQDEVFLELPSFSLSTKTDLIPPLKSLGVQDIFDEEQSDLSGISKTALVVSKAVQRAAMKIDEAGGLAAAATGFEIVPRSYVRTMKVDRPFLAMIVDKVHKIPLFLSTVMDPSRS